MKTLSLLFFALLLSSAASAQTLGSCKIFPSNNPWNQRVDSLPVHWNSAAYIAHVGASTHVHPDFGSDSAYGIPWEAVNGTQTFVPVIIDSINGYPDQSDPGPMPVPPNARVEQPPPLSGDGHVLIVDTSNHHLYELYQSRKDKNDNGWLASSTAIFALDSNNFRPDGWTSCDAAGLPIFPGLVRKYECDAGEIKHALRFTVQKTQKGWIFPARHHAGSTTDTTVMPMGLRMRLKASFNDSNFTGYAKIITTALKRYGIILADNGSNWYISGEWNPTWPDADVGQLKNIIGSDFEAVYTGPVRTTPNQYSDPVLPIPGQSGASISVPPVARDTSRVGSGNDVIIPISNNGSAPLTVNHYWLKYGSVFQFADSLSLTHSIAAGGNSLILVNFTPVVHGQAVDTLFIASSDGSSPTTAVPLIGWGTQGIFHLSANPLIFGSVSNGNSANMFVKVTNLGDGELDVYASSSMGTNPDFTLGVIGPQSSPPFVLQPGDTEVAHFIFAPTVLGPDTSIFGFTFADTANELFDTTLVMIGEGLPSSSVALNGDVAFDVNVFPNPSTGQSTISISDASGPSHIEITDQIGRIILKTTILSDNGTLDLSGFPNGCYFLHAQTPRGELSKLIEVLH